jgi:hypothetical protein
VEFAREANVFDAFTGHAELPFEAVGGVAMEDVWGLSDDLVQTRWRPSTRRLYQGWLQLWLALCKQAEVPALPANSDVLAFFITHLSLTRGAGTVAIAASAVVAFSALNDFQSPFKASPRAQSVLIGVKKARGGPRVPEKDGVSAEFVVRLWKLRMAEWQGGDLSFVKKRSWMMIQLGWEAAHRPGELHNLAVCDLVNAVWADKQRLATMTKGEKGAILSAGIREVGDVLDMVRLAKNDRKVKGQQTRLVEPVGEGVPSAVWLWRHMWRPTLHKAGFVVSRQCDAWSNPAVDLTRVHRCDRCPPLFPTMPAANRGVRVQNAVSTQAVSDVVREAAREIDMDHLSLSGKSLRIGGYSAATEEVGEEVTSLAAAELRWASSAVPKRVYKRRTVAEQRVKGLQQIQALESAARKEEGVAQRSQVVSVVVPVQVVSRRHNSCPLRSFPMGFVKVQGVSVCRRFQFGLCPKAASACKRLHVCHVHGVAHGVCVEAQAQVAAWQVQQRAVPPTLT